MRVTLRNPARRRGFSLIEVLVAMAILTIIVLIVAGIFQQTSLAWSLGLRRADEQSAVRAVVGALSRDLSMIVDPANFVIGPTHGNTSERDTAMEAGDLDAADGTLDGNTLDFWILRAPDLFDEDGTATRELYHVTYSGGNPVKREVKAFGAQGYDTPSDTSEEAGGGESEYDLGTGGSVRFEAISPDDDTKFASLYEALGVRVVVTPTRPPSVFDYEIYVGSCGPDGRWGTEDDIRPWVEGEN